MHASVKQNDNQATKTTQTNGSFFGGGGSAPFFQAKLTVNTPGDHYEQEADRVADHVMRMREGDAPVIQRTMFSPVSPVQLKCAECEQEKGEHVQRKEVGATGGQAAPPIVSAVLSSGGGQPLDASTQQFMGSRMGQDFSQVRVHTDVRAAESAGAIQARAYTSGRDVVFGAGEYQPESESGKRLLAHELVHVGQQGGAGMNRTMENQIHRKEHGELAQLPLDVIASCDEVASATPGIDQEQRIAGVHYAIESSSIDGRLVNALNRFAQDWHTQGGIEDVDIFGYASTDGAEDLNWRLSCQRANAVRDVLMNPTDGNPGIPITRLITHAQGETDKFGQGSIVSNRVATIVSTVRLNPDPNPNPNPQPNPNPNPQPQPNPTPGPAAMPNLKFWINAFIPSTLPGSFPAPGGPFKGRGVFPGPPHPDFSGGVIPALHTNGCFETDDRVFSNAFPPPSSRISIEIEINPTTGVLLLSRINGGLTFEIDCNTGTVLCTRTVSPRGLITSFSIGSEHNIFFMAEANDPCVTGSPSLSARGRISVNSSTRGFSFDVFTTIFPNFEMYLSTGGGARMLFLSPSFVNTPFSLLVPGALPHHGTGIF